MKEEDFPELFSVYGQVNVTLKEEMYKLEKAIKAVIQDNEELRISFGLVTTVKGIGFIVASHLIVYTHNFTRFDNWRKFACNSGIAPFDYQSGSSVRGKTQVSSIANMQVKKDVAHGGYLCYSYRCGIERVLSSEAG
ncbi:MAG: IS110 family transposase [Tannerellaceae bacterium]|jgi:transposase|nr:IS110 family transposase [Tannerellaceae bacterium]